jgi:hypothetical protein
MERRVLIYQVTADIIVSMVKSRVRRPTHKYGIEMPAPGRDIVQNAIDLG